MGLKDRIYQMAPAWVQSKLISLFNTRAYAVRYGGKYQEYRTQFLRNRTLSREALYDIQRDRYAKFIQHAITQSPYYKSSLGDIDNVTSIDNIRQLPIINKETLRKHIDQLVIQSDEPFEISKTGGTTGASLIVKYRQSNMQERFAMLDDFRSRFGYELGKKTAWFSGKNLLTSKDINNNVFWKMDNKHQVRYYSTFHIKGDYLKHYIDDLIQFKPEYIVGFPSSLLEIAAYGNSHNIDFPADTIKAIFPTAETIHPRMRTEIERFFKTKMYNQYASSEGAPFIFECAAGHLHLELQSGVFEVLDAENNPTDAGRLVITSFTTEGTPLIRYDIQDTIVLDAADKFCSCGNNNPLVKEIHGRIDDYVYSPQNGKINLGNVSNTLKDTKGIIRFQAIQDDLHKISLLVMVDKEVYSEKYEAIFIKNWRDRIGDEMELVIDYVADIPVEASGKYRFVKNSVRI